jgi:hypothetical protein
MPVPEPHVLPRPPEWARDAACRGRAGAEVDPWHPDEDDPAAAFLFALARRVCADCPVRLDCARAGVDLLAVAGVHGMWGGLKPAELRRLARENGYPARIVAQHGTRSRYVAGCHCPACVRSNTRGEHARRTGIAHGVAGLQNWRAGRSCWSRDRVSHVVTDGGHAQGAGLVAVRAGPPKPRCRPRRPGAGGAGPGPGPCAVSAGRPTCAEHERPGHRKVTGPWTVVLRRD